MRIAGGYTQGQREVAGDIDECQAFRLMMAAASVKEGFLFSSGYIPINAAASTVKRVSGDPTLMLEYGRSEQHVDQLAVTRQGLQWRFELAGRLTLPQFWADLPLVQELRAIVSGSA